MQFPTDIASILKRIENIDPIKYAKTRNFINGDVTYLSPYISRGVISIKQVKEIVVKQGYKYYQIEKYIQELAWREYFQRVWQIKRNEIDTDLKQTQPDFRHQQMILSVANAQTGIAAIDKQIQQFYETGYLHNHTRMYIASIVCNIGKAHWKQPSSWMYYHLLDGDLASNNCSWQWVASAFSSKKYYCNQQNINKYCNSNQEHTFLDKDYDALQTMDIPGILEDTTTLTLNTELPNTDALRIDLSKPTLIYNSYNLDPEWRKTEDVNRILLLEPSHFQDYPVSSKVIQFILELAKNIENLQIYTGEFMDLKTLTGTSTIISKEHPEFSHYSGIKDTREWMFPEITGFSFFAFWKRCEKYL